MHHTRNATGSHLRTTWIGPYLAQNYTCVLPFRLALGYGYTYLSYYSSPLAKYFDIAIFASAIRPWNVNLATKAYSKKVRNSSTICSARSLSAQRASRVVGSVINKVDHVSFPVRSRAVIRPFSSRRINPSTNSWKCYSVILELRILRLLSLRKYKEFSLSSVD